MGGDFSSYQDSYVLKKFGFVVNYQYNLAVYFGSKKKETPNDILEIYKNSFLKNELVFQVHSSAFDERFCDEFRKKCLVNKFTEETSKKFEKLFK